MEKLIDSVSNFVDSKLRNPFTNTFIISWLVFNWKPILFFIFSKTSAENKIWFITTHYSDIYHVLFLPIISTICIMIFVPAILWATDSPINYINIKRYKSDGKAEEEKKNVQDMMIAARKVGDVNNYIDNLKKEIKTYTTDLRSERTKNSELIEQYSKDLNEKNKTIESLQIDVMQSRSSATDHEILNANNNLIEENKSLKNKFIISLKREPKIVKTGETYVLEILNSNNEIFWYDFNNDLNYSPFGLSIYADQNAEEISDPEMLKNAVEKFKNSRFNI